MPTKNKLVLLGILIAIILAICAGAYWKGRRVGVATTKMVDVTKELNRLDEEKHVIHQEVHSLDTNALRNRILEQSDRLTHEAQASAR